MSHVCADDGEEGSIPAPKKKKQRSSSSSSSSKKKKHKDKKRKKKKKKRSSKAGHEDEEGEDEDGEEEGGGGSSSKRKRGGGAAAARMFDDEAEESDGGGGGSDDDDEDVSIEDCFHMLRSTCPHSHVFVGRCIHPVRQGLPAVPIHPSVVLSARESHRTERSRSAMSTAVGLHGHKLHERTRWRWFRLMLPPQPLSGLLCPTRLLRCVTLSLPFPQDTSLLACVFLLACFPGLSSIL